MRRAVGGRAVAVAGLVTLLVAGCRADRDEPLPAATVPTEAPQTTTNPYAVPAVIDVAYLNQVLAALDAANGDAFRLFLKARRMTPEVDDRIRALYGNGERAELVQRSYQAELADTLPPEPGNRITTGAGPTWRRGAANPPLHQGHAGRHAPDRGHRPLHGRLG